MNYYPFHLGDYSVHTSHLEPLEDLAYRRMLDAYYLREAALPRCTTEIARLIRMRNSIQEVESVLNEFFELTEAGWSHTRCDQEIERMRDKQDKARASAAASVDARRAKAQLMGDGGSAIAQQNINESSTNAQRTLNERLTDAELPTPTPTPITKEKSKPPVPPKGGEVSGEFAEFWDAYPKKVGKEAAWKVWKKLSSPVATLQNIKIALSWQRECDQWTKDQGQYIPNPATYLNQGRWQDERPEPRNTALTQVGQRAGRSAMQWLENGGYEKGLTQ